MMECSLNTVRRRSLYYFIKLKYAIDYCGIRRQYRVLLQMTSSLTHLGFCSKKDVKVIGCLRSYLKKG
jgi:hypothetical protein